MDCPKVFHTAIDYHLKVFQNNAFVSRDGSDFLSGVTLNESTGFWSKGLVYYSIASFDKRVGYRMRSL